MTDGLGAAPLVPRRPPIPPPPGLYGAGLPLRNDCSPEIASGAIEAAVKAHGAALPSKLSAGATGMITSE